MTAWQRHERIGECDLYLGDCLEVMPIIPNGSVRLLWTDPPYGHNNADGDLLSVVNSGALHCKAAKNGAKAIANDGMEDMKRVVDGMLVAVVPLLTNDSCCCCCCCCGGGPSPTFAWLASRMDAQGLSFFHSTIWDKVNPGLGWRYKRQHEMIMVAHKKGGKLAWSRDVEPVGNVLRNGWFSGQQRQHPNEKPLWLVSGFVSRHSDLGDLVLDPFMGSGTTGVACVQLGRKFTGIELDPEYFDIACRRIEAAVAEPRLALDEPPPKPMQPSFLEDDQ